MRFFSFVKTNSLKADFIAGSTVALVLIPQSLAYAQLAGLPAQFGLYAALLPSIIASIFGSSKYLATGPVAVLSLMTAASLSTRFTPESSEYIGAALFLSLVLGLFQLFLGITKMGGLVSFLSHPVIYGFTNAAAIIIATTQLGKFFGVSVGSYDHHYQTVIAVVQKGLSHADWVTFLFGAWALITMYAFRSLSRKLPAVLLTIAIATIFSMIIDYKGAIIGFIPLGLPKLQFPTIDVGILSDLLITVITMSLIGFTESISVAQAIAVKTKDRIDPNKELFGQGLANIVGSMFQSYPVSGSFSRTAVSYQAGAQSNISSFFTSVFVLLALLFFTQFLYFIPQVILAAVIVFSVSGLLDAKKIRHIWYTNKYDGVAALLTFVGTLYFAPHLDKGVALGVIFSVIHYVYRNAHPRIVFLSKYKDGALHDAERFTLDRCDNVAVIRLDAPLFFANASFFENVIINDVVNNKHTTDVIIVANGINEIDATGEEMLKSLFASLRVAGKNLYISDMKSQLLDVLAKTGLRDEIGAEHFFLKAEDAIQFTTKHLEKVHEHADKAHCPLKRYVKNHKTEESIIQDKRETIAYFHQKLFRYAPVFAKK